MICWHAKIRYPGRFLIEEFLALKEGTNNSYRRIDGVIGFRNPFVMCKLTEGERLVVIQSKNRRMGMASSARSSSPVTWWNA